MNRKVYSPNLPTSNFFLELVLATHTAHLLLLYPPTGSDYQCFAPPKFSHIATVSAEINTQILDKDQLYLHIQNLKKL